MATPGSFKISKDSEKLVIERNHPSKSHLYWQGFTGLGIVPFFLIGYLISQLELTVLVGLGVILLAPLIYVSLSLISAPWRTKETITLNKISGLLTYTKLGRHPWLLIKRNGSIGTSPPFLVEYFYFPLKEITSVHAMIVDTVDEFEHYLVLYFSRIDTYIAIWEYGCESSRVGYKAMEEIAQFLGQQLGEEINKPATITFNLSFVNDFIKNITQKQEKGIQVDPRKAFLNYDYKLAIIAALNEAENCRIIKSNPKDAYANLMLGLSYLGKGRKQPAIEHLQVAYNLLITQGDKCHAKRVMGYLSALGVFPA